jgi:hypothetical protein
MGPHSYAASIFGVGHCSICGQEYDHVFHQQFNRQQSPETAAAVEHAVKAANAARDEAISRMSEMAQKLGHLEGACTGLADQAERNYWQLRNWLDTQPDLTDWVHGDDGPAYPYMRFAKALREAVARGEAK